MLSFLRAGGALFLLLSILTTTAVDAQYPNRLDPRFYLPPIELPRPQVVPKMPPVDGVEAVDLALVLALDTSASVNQERWALQVLGYADAFRDRDVVAALRSGAYGMIAVTVVQWSDTNDQSIVIPWRILRDAENAAVFSNEIEHMRRVHNRNTALARAIDFSSLVIEHPPFKALRKVIDISGDGSDNRGGLVALSRKRVIDMGVTINGLPIIADEKKAKLWLP